MTVTPGRYLTHYGAIAIVGCEKSVRPGLIAGGVGILLVHWNPETGEQVPILGSPRVPGEDLLRRLPDTEPQ